MECLCCDQVWAVGYGMKSRLWFLDNPIAKAVQTNNADLFWSWDVGRTVRSNMGYIPMFYYDEEHGSADPTRVVAFGMAGSCLLGFVRVRASG